MVSAAPQLFPERWWFPWTFVNVPGICESRGIWRWTEIVVGRAFDYFSSREQQAILLHEAGHIKLHHGAQRIRWLWLVLFSPRRFADLCVEQEFQADRFAANCGYGSDLASALSRLKTGSSGSLHPNSVERIARLLACSRE